eukprot:TRINITY_DN16501_c0_g1_i1.p1 TRINITY_DN16501_c0_g1~~TRINITY_DN16501_c0_g1_i1.p1  ORF type:complete len:530 (+),score=111.83 TRINITY_DN16501_c0_g1_i1:58-1590(+)
MQNIIVVGAGLSGSLLAYSLKKRGFEVDLYESREDLRADIGGVHRSINLVLTSRGRYALRNLGLEDEVMKLTVPAQARAIHFQNGEVAIQPYGKDDNECNYSVSRAELNKHLLTVAEKAGVNIHFNCRLVDTDFSNNSFTFMDAKNKRFTKTAQICFGADGAGSVSRKQLIKHLIDQPVPDLELGMESNRWGGNTHVQIAIQRLGVSYKELTFPLKRDGGKPLDTRYLHIWPRGNHFLMGLANLDGSMTGTLYLPDETSAEKTDLNFDNVQGVAKVEKYMKEYYPDAIDILPNVQEEWKNNPHSFLATTRVSHWVYKHNMCLLGDAAHAVVPFFGQGMNASFEDVSYIEALIDKLHVSPSNNSEEVWATLLRQYQRTRIPAGHAISDLAIENYSEMCAKVGEAEFLKRKQIENAVESALPNIMRSRYWMVTNSLIPYHWVQHMGFLIDKVLDDIVAHNPTIENDVVQLDIPLCKSLIEKHLTPFITSHGIELQKPWKFYLNRELQPSTKL